MIAVAVLFALVLLRAVLILGGTALLVRPVDDCPACFQPTWLVQKPIPLRPVPWLEWRWCPACRWQGPGRRHEPPSGSERAVNRAQAVEVV